MGPSHVRCGCCQGMPCPNLPTANPIVFGSSRPCLFVRACARIHSSDHVSCLVWHAAATC